MSEPPARPDRPVADRLQALLNRAATEDEAVVESRVREILAEVRALRESVEAGQSRDRVADEVATLAAQVRSDGAEQQTSISALADTVRTVADETPAVRESVAELQEEVGRLRGRLDAVDALAEQLRGVQERVDAVPAELAALREDLRTVDVSDAVSQRADALQTSVDAAVTELRSAVAGVASSDALDAVVKRLGTVEETTVRAAAGVVELEDALAERVGEVTATVDGLRAVVDRVGVAVDDLPLRLDALREPDALPWLSALLAESAEQRTALQADLGDLRERLTGLDERVADVTGAVQSRPDPDPAVTADVVVERLQPVLAAEAERAVVAQVPTLLEGVERRLVAHVDEAVLVLAEALLRRRIPATLATADEEPDSGAAPASSPVGDGSPLDEAPSPDDEGLAVDEHVDVFSGEGPSSPEVEPAAVPGPIGGGRSDRVPPDDGSLGSRRRSKRSWRRSDGS